MLLNIYRGGRLTVFHLDAYRVGSADDFESIGFAELLEQPGVVVVEWADRIAKILPGRRIRVAIEVVGQSDRRVTVERLGESSGQS